MIEYLFKISADGKAALAETAKVTTALGGIQREAGGAENALGNMFSRLARTLGPITLTLKLIDSVFGAISRYSAISDQAQRAGVSAEKFQSWSYALKQSGVEPTSVFTAKRVLGKMQTEAIEKPDGEAARTFASLGISAQMLKGMGTESLLEALSVVAQTAPTSGPEASKFNTVMTSLLGRDADSLVGAFREGFITRVGEAKSKGLVLSEESVAKLDRTGDKLDELWERSYVFFGRLASLEAIRDMNASLGVRSKDDLLNAVKGLDDKMGRAVRILDDKL
jgi:hypothetical protein